MREFILALGPFASGWLFGRMISLKVFSRLTAKTYPVWWVDVVAALVVVLILGKWMGQYVLRNQIPSRSPSKDTRPTTFV